jgi:hypothetical protein
MITELAVERVEFACGHCWHQWSVDFDVQQWRDEENGEEWEYFSRDGIPAASPYTPAGAVPCPACGRHWVGRIVARRPVALPPGPEQTPRHQILDAAEHRSERSGAPLLGAEAHTQPEQLGPPGPGAFAPTPQPAGRNGREADKHPGAPGR